MATLLFTVVGLVSVYPSVQTNRSLAAEDYSGAREHSRIARAHAAFWFTLAALLFFGTITLLQVIGTP